MILARCDGCGASAFTENGRDPDGAVACSCCPEDHHHGNAANACPGGHEAQPCPSPPACPSWTGMGMDGDCPGGHHGKGVPGCTVCRPVTITVMAPPTKEAPHFDMKLADDGARALLGLEG